MVEISAWVAEIPRDNLPPDLRALLKDAGSEGLPLKAQVAAGIRERWGAAGGRVWAMPRVTTLDGRSAEIEIGPVPEVKDGPPGGIPKSRLELLAYRLANGASWSVEAKAAVGERAGAARKSIQDGDSVLLRLEATKEADGVVTVAIVTAVQIDPAGNRVHGVH